MEQFIEGKGWKGRNALSPVSSKNYHLIIYAADGPSRGKYNILDLFYTIFQVPCAFA